AALVATGVAALGGAILGEYDLSGPLPLLAGVLFGVVVAEAVIVVQRRPAPAAVGVAAVAAGAATVWSLWIANGHHLAYASATQWAQAGLPLVVVPAWSRTAAVGRKRAAGDPGAP
ncbi:MAG TPA: hypothetical protein VE990_01890, partial [Acidimicrobiales bacterium]|nr:hypothetical protein [Acidimicrobiales bacterium]